MRTKRIIAALTAAITLLIGMNSNCMAYDFYGQGSSLYMYKYFGNSDFIDGNLVLNSYGAGVSANVDYYYAKAYVAAYYAGAGGVVTFYGEADDSNYEYAIASINCPGVTLAHAIGYIGTTQTDYLVTGKLVR